jgi:hypothetical protein
VRENDFFKINLNRLIVLVVPSYWTLEVSAGVLFEVVLARILVLSLQQLNHLLLHPEVRVFFALFAQSLVVSSSLLIEIDGSSRD